MALEKIILAEQLGEHVRNTVENLNAELFALNQRGFHLQMPEKLAFSMFVVTKLAAFQIEDREVGSTSATDGGKTIETRSNKSDGTRINQGDDISESLDVATSIGENSHINEGESITTHRTDQ